MYGQTPQRQRDSQPEHGPQDTARRRLIAIRFHTLILAVGNRQ